MLHVHRDGFGFVHPVSSTEEQNVFLPPFEASRAVDGDRVLVEVFESDGRSEGRIRRVLERRRSQVVGTYFERGRSSWVVPMDSSLGGAIRVPATQLAREGDLVKVTLGVGSELLGSGEGLVGEVAGSLGKPGDPSAEVLSIVFAQGFSDEIPAEVMREADRVSMVVTPEEADGRRDLRSMPLVTIDGEDARDFDDAVYAERNDHGWRLWVAIADVTHYVHEGSALDAEALRRGTSVYLPNRVLPMLPERLSAGICSLRPEEDRLCMVAEMELDRNAQLTRSELYPAVMRSAARCTYNEVQDVLDGKDVAHRNRFRPQFEVLMELSRALTRMRQARGALDFDLPERKIVLAPTGEPLRMELRERKDSHRLIEECMLAANEAVARYFQEQNLPSIYRFHGEPDEEKLEAFAELARAYGFELPLREEITSKDLARFIKQLEGHPEQRSLNQLLLRSMMQAVYSAEQIGHYGLAAEHYLHFTSPIRRYPDLIVHRLLKAAWSRGKRSAHDLDREQERLEAMAARSSERERAAMQVEREVVAFYTALMMKDRVGEQFAATVSSVTDFGFFVELDEVHVEGLVRAETLGRGYRFEKALLALTYPTGRKVRVGQKLQVRLVAINVARRQLDLEVVAFEGEHAVEAPVELHAHGHEPRRRGERARAAPSAPVGRERHGPARQRAPRPAPAVESEAPAARAEGHGSPHPGFDRLRALAAQKGRANAGAAGRGAVATKAKPGKRAGGAHEERGGRSEPNRKGKRGAPGRGKSPSKPRAGPRGGKRGKPRR